jgi:hypothetical protein
VHCLHNGLSTSCCVAAWAGACACIQGRERRHRVRWLHPPPTEGACCSQLGGGGGGSTTRPSTALSPDASRLRSSTAACARMLRRGSWLHAHDRCSRAPGGSSDLMQMLLPKLHHGIEHGPGRRALGMRWSTLLCAASNDATCALPAPCNAHTRLCLTSRRACVSGPTARPSSSWPFLSLSTSYARST